MIPYQGAGTMVNRSASLGYQTGVIDQHSRSIREGLRHYVMAYSALAVADYIVRRQASRGVTLTPIAAIVFFWFLAALFAVAVGITAWNILAPQSARWLSDSDLGQLKALIVGVVLSRGTSAFVGKYAK
jgi:hypothetical protein